MVETDTIVAIATPLGWGGLGVVRVSGTRALSIVQSLFVCSRGCICRRLEEAASHTLHHGFLQGSEGPIDEVVVGLFRAPHSYTGEDVLEISCHGGPFLLQEIVELCLSRGGRMAEPGEFTKRAYLNGKMDLTQAEAVADLIGCRSKAARRLALSQLRGGLSSALLPLKRVLTELLASVEANMDFVEEDIPAMPRQDLISQLSFLIQETGDLILRSRSGRLMHEGARLALVGKPNAGKSSLFNQLVNFNRAIVTAIPGTTRDTLEEGIEVNGYGIVLIDTAGWRLTEDPIETEGISRTKAALESADGALFVMDCSRALGPEDETIAECIGQKPVLAVLNKADLAPVFTDHEALSLLSRVKEKVPALAVSSKTGQGMRELKLLLPQIFCDPHGEAQETLSSANARHLSILGRFQEALEACHAAAVGSLSIQEECIALELKKALEILGEITGENAQEEVLNAIFSKFCIGK